MGGPAPAPRLSAVIPSRDTRELTQRCVGALLAGEQEGIEVLVVDDGSGDGTATAIPARHPGVQVLPSPLPGGFTAAANRGLARARGEVLLLLNSDTEVEAATLPRLLGAFREDPGLGVAGAALRYPGGEAQWGGGPPPTLAWLFALASGLPRLLERLPGYRRLRPLDARRRVAWVSGAAMGIRRSTWEEVGPLDEGFRFYCQDLDFCLRAGAAGWRVALVPGFRVLHHHGATISGSGPEAAVERARLDLLWPDLLRWAAKARGRRWAHLARASLRAGGLLRILALAATLPLQPAPRRLASRREIRAVRTAAARLRP